MVGRKHILGLGIVALVLAGTGAAAVLLAPDAAPFPGAGKVLANGFAAWPVDTPEEARAECAVSPEWRKDPEAVAERFAADVLGYPEPTRSDDFDAGRANVFRTLIGTRRSKDVFLGSVITLERFGHCWYVTAGEGREGGWGIDIVTIDDGTKLVVPMSCCGWAVEVGWGPWTETIEPDGDAREAIVDIPEEAHGQPGHYIAMSFDNAGVSEVVGATTLPPIPTSRGTQPITTLDAGAAPDDRRLCDMGWARKTDDAERAFKRIRNWIFATGRGSGRGGSKRLDAGTTRLTGADQAWRVRYEGTDLTFTLGRAADRCWMLRSIVPNAPLIEQIAVNDTGFTFDLEPRNAGKVVGYYGVGIEQSYVSIESRPILDEIYSVPRYRSFEESNDGLPAHALVMTYRKGKLYSAEYRMFEMPEV